MLDLYRTLRPGASREDLLIAALTGSNFWVRTVMLAERKAAAGARRPVYMYSLDWRSPACDGRLQAHHAMDLPFVFDNTDVPDTTKGAPGARELAAIVSATWAAFARTGSPENPALPRWPAYTRGRARDDGVRPRLPRRHRPRPRRPPVVGARSRRERNCSLGDRRHSAGSAGGSGVRR